MTRKTLRKDLASGLTVGQVAIKRGVTLGAVLFAAWDPQTWAERIDLLRSEGICVLCRHEAAEVPRQACRPCQEKQNLRAQRSRERSRERSNA